MKIIYLVSKYHWDHKLCRARFLAINPLNPRVTGKGWDDYTDISSVGNPDAVIAYKPSEHPNFSSLKCTKIIQCNEIKSPKFLQEIEISKPDIVVMHHLNDYNNWCNELKRFKIRTLHVPHVADPSIFYDQKLERIWDVITVGAVAQIVYPLRVIFKEVLEILKKRGRRCLEFPHPGNILNKASSNEHLRTFSAILNKSKITCFCSSKYRYRLSKYVEVPACGSVIASDIPMSEEDLSHILECNVNESPKEIADKIDTFLESKQYSQYVKKGYAYASRYTPEYYCKRLLDLL